MAQYIFKQFILFNTSRFHHLSTVVNKISTSAVTAGNSDNGRDIGNGNINDEFELQ
jgi:hypothetical protein